MKSAFISAAVILGVFTSSGALSGCASHKTTVHDTTEQRTTTYDDPAIEPDRDTVVHERSQHTTTTTEDHPAEHHGLFQILGDIISLPFRAVGALFTAIF